MSKDSYITHRQRLFIYIRLLVAVMVVLVLGGCASTNRKTSTTSQDSKENVTLQESKEELPPARAVKLLPLLEIDSHTLPATLGKNYSSDIGGYTRFYVTSIKTESEKSTNKPRSNKCESPATRCYADEARSLWGKVFMGRELSRVLSVKINLRNPTITTTATLASASYESSLNRGESWTTELNENLLLTPYFRISNNSVARIEATINASDKGKDQVSGKILEILQSASELVAPTSALLTSLNANRVNQASQFVEQSLSGLFSNALVERSSNDFTSAAWNFEKPLITINANFPLGNKKITAIDAYQIGVWQIKVAMPIISIFSNVPAYKLPQSVCDYACSKEQAALAYEGLTPSEVLNFSVAENLTLKQALITDPAVSIAIDDLKKGGNVEMYDLAMQLCNRIDERAQLLGFNRFDAAVILWAFSHGAGLEAKRAASIRADAKNCKAADLWNEIAKQMNSNAPNSVVPAPQSSPLPG